MDGSSGNRHFHNMARWRGRTGDMYIGVIFLGALFLFPLYETVFACLLGGGGGKGGAGGGGQGLLMCC